MVIKYVFISITLFITPLTLAAQSSQVLERYIQEGLQHNLMLKQEQLEVKKVAETVRQAKALFYPQVNLAPTYSVAMGGRRLEFPVGDMVNPINTTLNLLTGTNSFPTDIPNVNELLAPHNFHDTKITFQLSLYNPEIRYNYLIQQSQYSAREATLKVAEQEIRFEIENAYYQYLQALEAGRILSENRRVLTELARLNGKLVANNVLTKDAVFSAEYEVSKMDQLIAEAGKNIKTARSYFNFLLNRELADEIEADTVSVQAMLVVDTSTVNTSLALQNRKELEQLKFYQQSGQLALRMHELSAWRPSVFLGGNTGFQGYGYTFRNQGYLVGQVGLQWTLFKGFEKKYRIQESRIQADIMTVKLSETEQKIRLQVDQATGELSAAIEGYKAAEAGLKMAENYFKMIDSRYRNHQVLLLEYLKAQQDLLSASIQLTIRKREILIRQANLRRVTGENSTDTLY